VCADISLSASRCPARHRDDASGQSLLRATPTERDDVRPAEHDMAGEGHADSPQAAAVVDIKWCR